MGNSRRVLGGAVAAIGLGLVTFAFGAGVADAHTPNYEAVCNPSTGLTKLTYNFTAYDANPANMLTVIDTPTSGSPVTLLNAHTFGTSYSGSHEVSGAIGHTFTLKVVANGNPNSQYSKTYSAGPTAACVESSTTTVTETVTSPVTETVTSPVTETVTSPVTETVTSPVTETETVTSPVTETETVTSPVTETVTSPDTETVTSPVTETETVTSPVTETETSPVESSEPVTSETPTDGTTIEVLPASSSRVLTELSTPSASVVSSSSSAAGVPTSPYVTPTSTTPVQLASTGASSALGPMALIGFAFLLLGGLLVAAPASVLNRLRRGTH